MAMLADFRLIREIVQSGGHKHVVGGLEQTKYKSLVELGWLKMQSSSDLKHAHYQVTERGKAAAARS
jgi:hypothetical protein